MLDPAQSPLQSVADSACQEDLEPRPTSPDSQPSLHWRHSQITTQPDGSGLQPSLDAETQKVVDRAKTMSDKNRAAQKRYRDRQRDKLESYKRQVEELTEQVQRLTAEKESRAPAAIVHCGPQRAPQHVLQIEEPGSLPLSSDRKPVRPQCSGCSGSQPLDLNNPAAVCRGMVDLGKSLASRLPESRHLANLLKDRGDDFEGTSQALALIWQAYISEIVWHLTRGGADSSSPYHSDLIKLCGILRVAKRSAMEKNPLLVRWIQFRLRHVSPPCDYVRVLDALYLTAPQLGGVLRAQQALRASLGAIAKTRRECVQPLLAPVADGSEVQLAEYHLRHHHACQSSQALFAEENTCFITFVDGMYQALGLVTIARLYAETSSFDFLTLAAAVEKTLTSPSATLQPNREAQQQPSVQLPVKLHPFVQLPIQQQPLPQLPMKVHPSLQLPQQLPVEIHPSVSNFVEALPEFGRLSPSRSTQLFGLDFLRDATIASGLGAGV
ncbi:hypothetical protein WJX74_005757 [Apatococcus lobatus]|uniref:BZIP domain-containing protein n=2 Tax=Apatococcus TaxID=904362 RepID=A0AAW1TEB8_9CHLO